MTFDPSDTATLPTPDSQTPEEALPAKAVRLAEQLLRDAKALETTAEKEEGEKLAALMSDQAGKELTFHLTDRILRSCDNKRAAELFRALLQEYGAPAYLTPLDRFLMKLGAFASRFFPNLVMSAIANRLQKESHGVILPAEPSKLQAHIERRQLQNAEVNLNILGEAVLSEEEALKRLQQNIRALENSTTDYLSIKLSAIYSQINLTAYQQTREELASRLRKLYRAALTQKPAAFVNLDMEEYRDLALTLDVFRDVLDESEFLNLRAGIVLQAYLPDAYPLQKLLTTWAKNRLERGGAAIKIRLVKGANLAMEAVDAELHDWPQAPYTSKEEVDANYKRMLQYACIPENAAAINIGVASHNLFDLAYALVLQEQNNLKDLLDIEMLEGMAPSQSRAVLAVTGKILFYTPIVYKDDFEAAIAYLIRRLDENTTDGNYLRDIFQIAPGNETWNAQKERFLIACEASETTPVGPRRGQDRSTEEPTLQEVQFENCADTDFSLPANRKWLADNLAATNQRIDTSHREGAAAVEKCLRTATESNWSQTSVLERSRLLRQCAVELSKSRADLIHIMNSEGMKAPAEADVEISEAVDFANYYANGFQESAWSDGLLPKSIGPVLITPPWNFPCAIPCGGILAALMAGNPVIIKPAPETIAIARVMTESLWRAGIPSDALQFITVPDDDIGKSLVTDPRVSALILTGSSQTAKLFLDWKPDLALYAETSGKNSLIITSAADPDLAIKDLVKSAFSHSGQKCSAASIALVERSLLDNTTFLSRLKETAASLKVGPISDRTAIITPLIQEPSPDLLRGLTKLDHREEWLLQPQSIPTTPNLWSPGIRIKVQAGSWVHRTELFGPVLAIIPFDSLEEAIAIQNSTAFGLTGGIHTLDPVEIESWQAKVEVGNAYINRSITGAIVQRQPFGGWKNSSLGPGAKAGGPNYISQFTTPICEQLPKQKAPLSKPVAELYNRLTTFSSAEETLHLQAAADNAAYWWQEEFSIEHDPSQLQAESNIFRYRPVDGLTLRLTSESSLLDIGISALMAKTAAVPLTLSSQSPLSGDLRKLAETLQIPFLHETKKQLAQRLKKSPLTSLRTPGQPSLQLHNRNHHHPITPHARLELLPYLLEQSLSKTRHRHGRIEAV